MLDRWAQVTAALAGHRAVLVAALLLAAGPLFAQTDSATAARAALDSIPLFASHDALSITIEAPLETIFAERDQDSEEFPGLLTVRQPNGDSVTLDVQIRTRGNTRRQKRICRFPPLRLDFDRDSVAGTVFEAQNKLKLVTHCDDNREEHEQYVLLEYLAYRVYNLLTEYSFRVRLARIEYLDTDGKRDPVTRYAFMIEDDGMVAARTGWMSLEVPAISPNLTDPDNLALMEVFEYFIGNTDYSAFGREREKDMCCHNTRPIGDSLGPIFSIPYDFDLSGLVDTRYANRLYGGNLEKMGIRRVRDRLYRGWCASLSRLPDTFTLFNEKREEIYSLFRDQVDLDPEVLEETLEFLDEFYEVINDEGKARRAFRDRCRA